MEHMAWKAQFSPSKFFALIFYFLSPPQHHPIFPPSLLHPPSHVYFSFPNQISNFSKNSKIRSNPSRAFFANANPCPAPGWIYVSNPFAPLNSSFNGTANRSSLHNPAQNNKSLPPVATRAAPLNPALPASLFAIAGFNDTSSAIAKGDFVFSTYAATPTS